MQKMQQPRFRVTVPRGVFAQNAPKSRGSKRETAKKTVSVQREACYCPHGIIKTDVSN